MTESLSHIGVKRKSGRYPWGSGEEPYQHEAGFLQAVQDMRKSGMSEKEIATFHGMSTGELRAMKTAALESVKAAKVAEAVRLKEKGLSNVAIGERMGLNESSVRALLKPSVESKRGVLEATQRTLTEAVAKKGPIDIGTGVEAHMGISREKLNAAVAQLQAQGYKVYYTKAEQLGTGKETSIKALVPPGMTYKEFAENAHKLGSVYSYSPDKGHTFLGMSEKPVNVDLKRVQVRWKEEGGTDRDGVIELRRGVDDISLGGAKYAQVRIKVNNTHYLKGMAMYADDLPKGIDMRFNTNKSKSSNKLDAMKELKDDPDNPFGATVHPKYYVGKDGKRKASAINIVNEEGTWNDWSRNLASQFLSKQSPVLVKKQLGITKASKKAQFDEIQKLTNPAVRKKLLQEFADSCDSAATHLKAAKLPRQATQVLLPLPKLKEGEIYAPNFKHGEKVSLVRYPHGGIFEIPTLTVNNKSAIGKKLIGMAKDAVGIHPKVAERLSGADFDGDTAVCIPNNDGKVRTAPALSGLKNYDPKISYPGYPGMKVMSKGETGNQMGRISNLITDMTVKGATPAELARAVRHSMTVIDAHKHKLDYRLSERDNGIKQLQEKYQKAGGGAATIISRSTGDRRVPQIKPRSMSKGGPIDKKTGELVYEPTGATYHKPVKNKNGDIVRWVETQNLTKMPNMMLTKDARTLVSEKNTPTERVYAAYANNMKALANKARLAMINTPSQKQSPSAKKVYANELKSLRAKLEVALKNAPRERQAQLYAGYVVKQKKASNPDMDKDEVKRLKNQALAQARARFGASKAKSAVHITDKEWEAIQAGAVSHTFLEKLMNNTDMERVKQLATPRGVRTISPSQRARAKALLDAGYTQGDVADALGVSVSFIQDLLEGGK